MYSPRQKMSNGEPPPPVPGRSEHAVSFGFANTIGKELRSGTSVAFAYVSQAESERRREYGTREQGSRRGDECAKPGRAAAGAVSPSRHCRTLGCPVSRQPRVRQWREG